MTDPVTRPTPAAVPGAGDGTHACIRCGAPVALDVGLCERCNPLGLKDVAASQVHGTVFVAVVGAIIVLALAARLAVSGVGPFEASVSDVTASGDALTVTLTVTNRGDAEGQSPCRVTDPNDRNGVAIAIILSPRIGPGQTATFSQTVTGLGAVARELAVRCPVP